jgi:hypothetical protein
MRRVLEEFKAGGLSRREFCQQRSIPLTTFECWRREHGVKPLETSAAAADGGCQSDQRGTGVADHAKCGERTGHRKLVAVADQLPRLIRIAEGA